MGISRKSWFRVVHEKFLLRSSPRRETIIILHTNNTSTANFIEESTTTRDDEYEAAVSVTSTTANRIVEYKRTEAQLVPTNQWQEDDYMLMSIENIAATKIQTYFRSHLARRAYRALRSLVKLQAAVRGVIVRRQARLALDCMHALARLQVTVRARQLLGQCPTG